MKGHICSDLDGSLRVPFEHQVKVLACFPLQALSSLPGRLCELLRSLHVHSLKNEEVLLLKDSRRLAEHKDAGSQVGDRTFTVKERYQCVNTRRDSDAGNPR